MLLGKSKKGSKALLPMPASIAAPRLYKYKKLPEIPVFLSKHYADIRLKTKSKSNAKTTDLDISDEDYITVVIDGYVNDCIRSCCCGLISC